ncbi:MAG: hypothetical protein E6J74_01890 [Deltaproteobacteria bacterium]|nr:MAG: hypothetical protein E6J74_01890 [Deltaproteobacteria bacterium]
METVEPSIVCIVGMHRSGTSMIARLLHQCGLDLGPAERLLKADATNPLGHFEHRGFLDIDRQLLKHFKATWREPPELQAGWHLDPGLKPLLSEAKALAATFDGRSPWGWKEPRASLFLPFWKEAIPNMRFVICIRNPLEVARSLETRNNISIRKGPALWYRYVRASLEDTEGSPRIFSFFEDFFHNGSGEIARLLRFCGLPVPSKDSDLNSAVASELRHHTSAIRTLLAEPCVTSECKHFYLGLRAIVLPHFSRVEGDRLEPDSATVSAFVKLFKDFEGSPAASAATVESPEAQSRLGDQRSTNKLKKLFESLSVSKPK